MLEYKDPNDGLTQQEIFKKNLPNVLYMDHYTLNEMYPQYTAEEWRRFMRDQQTFIESELAAIAEAEARAALSRLGRASGTEVSALKALLETSKLINDSQRQQTKIMMTYLPDPKTAKQPESEKTERPIIPDYPDISKY